MTSAPNQRRQPHILFWGTYDKGKPRNRILLAGLRANGATVTECHAEVWEGVEDKSRLSTAAARLRLSAKWLISYPGLVVRYLRAPRHDAVLVGYMGQLDVIVLWPFARLRGVPVVFDALMSLYNAVVEDRRLLDAGNPWSRLLFAWEWLSCRAADAIVVNTRMACAYWVERFGVRPEKMCAVLTGAETDAFPPRPRGAADGPVRVLFYGTFIPLHGIETIVRAARLTEAEDVDWMVIGHGQEAQTVRELLDAHPLPRLTWIPWVPYEELASHIHAADVCLGLFGETRRAGWSIPNKIFQILATGTPLITRESDGILELLSPQAPGVYLVPPGDPQALADAVRRLGRDRAALAGQALHREAVDAFKPETVGCKIVALVRAWQR